MRKLEIAVAGLSGLGLVLAIVLGTTEQNMAGQDALASEDASVGAIGALQEPQPKAVLTSSQAETLEQIAPAAGDRN